MAFDFMKLRKSIAEATEELDKRKKRVESLRQEREFLSTAPIPKSDVVDILMDGIDRDAGKYPQYLAAAIRGFIESPGMEITDAHGIPTVAVGPLGMKYDRVEPAGFCWIFREQIKAGVRAAVEVMEWPENVGPRLKRHWPSRSAS